MSSSDDEDDMVVSKPHVKRVRKHTHSTNRVEQVPCFDTHNTSECDGDTELCSHLLAHDLQFEVNAPSMETDPDTAALADQDTPKDFSSWCGRYAKS